MLVDVIFSIRFGTPMPESILLMPGEWIIELAGLSIDTRSIISGFAKSNGGN